MFNPFNSQQSSGSYVDLLSRMTRRVQENGVADRVFEAVQQAFERQLEKERIVLSRQERARLLRQVMQAVLTEMLGKINRAG